MTFVPLLDVRVHLTIVKTARLDAIFGAEEVALTFSLGSCCTNLRKGYFGLSRRHLQPLGPRPFGKENATC